MARIRSLKPEFWTDGDVMDLSPHARMLFAGSWNFTLCDYGHLPDDPRRLKMQILPADDVMMVRDPAAEVGWRLEWLDPAALVDELVAAGRLVRIEVEGRSYLHVKRFTEHQRLETRWTPRCPVCRASSDHPEPRGTSREVARARATSAPDRTGQDRTSAAAAAETPPQPVDNLPGKLQILRGRLEAHKLTVRWDRLTAEQIAEIEELIDAHGDSPLVKAARSAYQPDNPIQFAQGWLKHWRALSPGGLRAVPEPVCDVHPAQGMPARSCSYCAADRLAGDA